MKLPILTIKLEGFNDIHFFYLGDDEFQWEYDDPSGFIKECLMDDPCYHLGNLGSTMPVFDIPPVEGMFGCVECVLQEFGVPFVLEKHLDKDFPLEPTEGRIF
jgi:hypothetical protein